MIAARLPDGRLHLQHGPIDLLCRAWGEEDEVLASYAQAIEAFPQVLPRLCADLPRLRTPLKPSPPGRGLGEGGSAGTSRPTVADAMVSACLPYASGFITPMAAVAGAVADHVLGALCAGRRLLRAFVNNGGDIAVHLGPGQALRCGLVTQLAAPSLDGVFTLAASHPARGVATSGRACKGTGGRSFSFGIADAVTILARTAATADAAATIVANAVDLPGHGAIRRRPAAEIDPDSDLGHRHITWDVGPLDGAEIEAALDGGLLVADDLIQRGLILGAVLVLRGRVASRLLRVTAPGIEGWDRAA